LQGIYNQSRGWLGFPFHYSFTRESASPSNGRKRKEASSPPSLLFIYNTLGYVPM